MELQMTAGGAHVRARRDERLFEAPEFRLVGLEVEKAGPLHASGDEHAVAARGAAAGRAFRLLAADLLLDDRVQAFLREACGAADLIKGQQPALHPAEDRRLAHAEVLGGFADGELGLGRLFHGWRYLSRTSINYHLLSYDVKQRPGDRMRGLTP
jgi:hypothetical protein